ncbi:S8 family serine peptidase, partial [bacterium]|nr:S8 family serine peptidase [bacterium]
MSRWRPFLYATVFMWVAMALLTVRARATPYEIAFQGSPFIPPAEEFSIPSDAPGAFDGRVHVLVQLWEHLEQGDRSRFLHRGVSLLHYFPDRAYVASIPVEFDASALQSLGVRWAGALPVDSKIHPRIRQGDFSDWSRYESEKRVFALSVVKDVTLSRARTYLTNHGFIVGDELRSTHVLFVAALPAQVEQLAAYDFVLFIAEAPPPLTETNDVARLRVHADECQALPYDLHGRGVTALVFDCAQIDRTHHDFSSNRIVYGENGVPFWHPTHVAGTLGGNGANSGGQYRGIAPEVRMVSMHYRACIPHCLYDSPQDIEDDYETAMFSYGADVANNSISSNVASNGYCCQWEGDYETTSQLLDAIVRGSLGQPFIAVFAAGNERTAGAPPGRCGDGYGTMGVPAGAKNIITVGASDDVDGMAPFSSWGPTDDGRIKPELCAPGVNIMSTSMDNSYYSISGTSMATPVVSGSIALLLEQWHRMLPNAPLPETVKALLIASAKDVGSPGPDFEFGYGILDIRKAVDFLLNLGFLEGELAVGETFSQTFVVSDTVGELNIALAWSDVPGEYNVTNALVN